MLRKNTESRSRNTSINTSLSQKLHHLASEDKHFKSSLFALSRFSPFILCIVLFLFTSCVVLFGPFVALVGEPQIRTSLFYYMFLEHEKRNDGVMTSQTSTKGINKKSIKTVDITKPFDANNRLNVAIAILITKEPDETSGFLDGAGTLALSIENAHSIHDITLIALVHEDVHECLDIFEFLGFEIIRKPIPIRNEDIKNREIAKVLYEMLTDGCCGMLELLKLYTWTWTEYDVVISMDADMLVHSNFDEIFDVMFKHKNNTDMEISRVDKKYPPKDTSQVITAKSPNEPYILGWTHGATAEIGNELMNGGFLVVRPNMQDYNNIIDILLEGDFRNDGTAWRGSNVAWTYGGRTIQGVVPYYYFQVRPDMHVELPRCKYNNMAEIERCRRWYIEDVLINHFTWCQKPWTCADQDVIICQHFTQKWWKFHRQLETWLELPTRPQCPYQPLNWRKSPKFLSFLKQKHDRAV
ncbi:hypothetical protein RFI_13169 [Reticulomyxa filosa]|uniref:Uncharacterized protein n=1 Tax=Reticulomyxa filosa TaxID=46433 RepID=X6NCF9_RETFI|nr:hypothetical protein RFI_13169 [Reticulomyxa filosa]|eukprot:ETO23990.1 hypothetical protein RFI_13169 [Reticulomyxa filosa]